MDPTAVFCFGISPHLDTQGNVLASMPPLVPCLVVAVIALYMLFMHRGNAPGAWVIMTELFPPKIRGIAMGFTVLCIGIANAIIDLVSPT